MPLKEYVQNTLIKLNLKEGTELYTLAQLIIEAPPNNKGKNKQQWEAVITYFCSLAERGVHDTVSDEHSTQIGNIRTPLVLFVQLASFGLVRNSSILFLAILKKTQGSTRAKTPKIDIGIYDRRVFLLAIESLCNTFFEDDLLLTLMQSPNPTIQTNDEHFQRIFAPLKAYLSKNEKVWLQLLQGAASIKTTLSCPANSVVWQMLIKALLDCNPDKQLNDLVLPPFTLSHDAEPFSTPLSLCELAVKSNNAIAFKLFIPKTNLLNRWNAFILGIQLNRDMVSVLIHDAEIFEKIATEGQGLLKLYFDQYATRNPLTTTEPTLEKLFIIYLLNAGVIYDSRIEAMFAENLRSNPSFPICSTIQFFNATQAQTLGIKTCSEILHTIQHTGKCNLFLNARDMNGNTIFYIMFEILMKADASHFNSLLRLIMTEDANVHLRNKADQTIHSLTYLTDEQKELLRIAENIACTNKLCKKLDTIQPTDPTSQSLKNSIQIRLEEIILNLMKLSPESLCPNFYFETFKLYLYYEANIADMMLPKMNNMYMQHIELTLLNKKGPYLWEAINDTMSYAIPENSLFLTIQLSKILNMLLEKLKLQPETLSFTPEQFKSHHIQHPYKTAFNLSGDRKFSMITSLLKNGIPFDVIVDEERNNSLLNAMIELKKFDIARLMLNRIYQCPNSLTLANNQGNTPLHTTLIAQGTSGDLITLLDALQENGYDADTVNKENLSPFYLALLHKQYPNAAIIFRKQKVSLSRECLLGTQKLTAFDLWALAFQPLVLPAAMSLNDKKQYQDYLTQIFSLGTDLLKGGAFFPTSDEYLSQLKSALTSFKQSVQTLWDTKDLNNPFIQFNKTIANLSAGWQLIKRIEDGFIIPYSDFQSLNCLMNTHRCSDKKTIWEAIFERNIFLKQCLDKVLIANPEDEAKIAKLKKWVAYLDRFLSLLILEGAVIGKVHDEIHQIFVSIVQKIEILNTLRTDFLKSGKSVAQKTEDEQETKELAQSMAQKMIAPEQLLIEQARQISEQLENIEEAECYKTFKAFCYLRLANNLFCVDKLKNNLLISKQTLMLTDEFIQKAEQLTRSFKQEDANLRTQIVSLSTTVSLYLSNKSRFDRMKHLLQILLPTQVEHTLRLKEPQACSEMYAMVASHGNIKMGAASFLTVDDDFLCTAIPAALERGEKEMENLNHHLKEAMTRENALKEEIAHLKQMLAAKENEQQKSGETPVEIPTPTILMSVRKPESQAVEDAAIPSEKRVKVINSPSRH